ncbi:2-(1,2-epoxy-1,2-dihydrophenyl)acetyl-CoA isomerase [Paraburkholderia sp. GAS448]|uniref:enoyl-CoA hydratase-related protein n=1 Tax=Paraburkholderia sp. GAS448 TaxID=3035136 RepID=UPI003D20C8FC
MTSVSDTMWDVAEDSVQRGERGELTKVRDGRVLILTLNRPESLNALTPYLHQRLLEALREAASDKEVGAVVLCGAGRAFCSGGDMRRPEASNTSDAGTRPSLEDRADSLLHHGETARLLHTMPKPTIAMINGVAAGAGLALALACDMRFAARGVTLTTSYVRVAMSGDLGVSYFLTQLVGSAKARELMFVGDKISAEEALRIGLVTRVEDAPGLRQATLHMAARLADGPAIALRYIKQNIARAEVGSLDEVMECEAFHMARCSRTQDVKEAALAFREKRMPRFTGT